jgi:hypothetical protein
MSKKDSNLSQKLRKFSNNDLREIDEDWDNLAEIYSVSDNSKNKQYSRKETKKTITKDSTD